MTNHLVQQQVFNELFYIGLFSIVCIGLYVPLMLASELSDWMSELSGTEHVELDSVIEMACKTKPHLWEQWGEKLRGKMSREQEK